MSKNANLHAAKANKNDEFYTQMKDIEDELVNYQDHFRGKTIFLNCDDPESSNFWKWFEMRFEILGLKRLISTHYEMDGSPSYMLELTAGGGRQSPVKTPLKGNGDFRSDECVALLDEADIVVTNPPFSLFREFVALLIKHKKKFLIIGSQNAITYKEFFPLLKDNQVWLGYYTRAMAFEVPETYDGAVKDEESDKYFKKLGNVCWYTNLDHDRRHQPMILYKRYSPDKYPKYDNYDAIEVNEAKLIPNDYDGVMGVGLPWFDKFNPDQFEIVGLTSGRQEFGKDAWPIKRYENAIQHNKDGTVCSGSKANTRATLLLDSIPEDDVYYTADNANGPFSIKFSRILVRNLNPKQPKNRKDN